MVSATCPRLAHPRLRRQVRHRELFLEATGADADPPVNDLLIRFCAAFLDQGFAPWQLPRRGEGFYRSFCALYRQPYGPPDRWMRGLAAGARAGSRMAGVTRSNRSSNPSMLLGVGEAEWEGFLSETFLALPGWGGMVRQVESRGDRAVHPIPPGSLVEFLSVRLILDRFSLAHTRRARALVFTGPLLGSP